MPHKKDHKIRVEDLFWQSPIPQPSLLPVAPNIGTGLFDEEFNETPDERMFRENEEFYKEHPTDTLELSPTGHTTQYGRKVYKDQFNAIHSETTVTVPAPNGGWMNIPSIYNGRYVTEDRARDIIINNGMVDPETGEKVRVYASDDEAVEAAKQRMRTLNKPDQPWNQSAPKKDGSFLDWLIPQAGAAGLVPQERENLFDFNAPVFPSVADTEFMVEAGRFGKTDPTTQLGLDWWWDTKGKRTQIFDTGESFDPSERGGKGWTRHGLVVSKGELPEGIKTTADEWAKAAGYKDGADWFYTQKAKGNIREGLTFKEWQEDMLELGKDQTLVMYAQAMDPLQPETWTHELGHIGQNIIRAGGLDLDKIEVPWYKKRPTDPFLGSTKEAKQRVRDIMMSSPGQKSYDEAHDWLQRSRKDDKGNPDPYTEKEIRNLSQQVLLEDKLANLKLESRWGFTLPSGSLSQYEEESMPDVWDKLRKRISGLIDTWDMGLFD